MCDLDESDQAFGLLNVSGPAGFLQLLGEGCQPMRTEGGARGFEAVGRGLDGVGVPSLPGLSKLGDLSLRAGEVQADDLVEHIRLSRFLDCGNRLPGGASGRPMLIRPRENSLVPSRFFLE